MSKILFILLFSIASLSCAWLFFEGSNCLTDMRNQIDTNLRSAK